MTTFEGQRVLVIGASSGIGRAAADAFVKAGADVTTASRDRARIEAAAREIGARPEVLDILDPAAVEQLFARSDPFDHVVVSAASTSTGSVSGLPLEDAYAAMDSKFWGAYRVARSARITPTGSLTFVSGFLGQRPSPRSVLQGAINAALEGLARGLALERAPVRVNVVSPGLIDTPLHDRMAPEQRQTVFRDVAARLPVGRVGAAEDVASAILFVAANRFATGSVVTVDGGGTIA
ncbi:SDR family oxidoreductase [Phenylobacterium sp.]|uniref:SDR family oxidoreductase n=1 Tax=Phenylobacterium sp. TaxID=1871053 RepID=UPI002810B11B|nr:SDR family oxidoreductase [Phenylobacterium sp.]